MIPLLSKENHFKFGYDNQWFVPRLNENQNWTVQYGQCTEKTSTFKIDCLKTAQQIHADANSKITVLFSGGVDSEVALQSFVLAGIPVTASILRFKNDLNLHDISFAVAACERLGVPYYFFDLDLLHFWENNLFDYADPTYCISPQLLSTMWLVDQISEYTVMGSGECLLVKDVPSDYKPGQSPYEPSDWFLWEKEKIAAWFRHFIFKNRPGCPSFFQYTPEVILSYLKDPLVTDLINNKIIGKLSTESSKLKIYQQHFNLVDRDKYTGFEKVQTEDAFYRKKLTDKFKNRNEIFKTNVKDLLVQMAYR